MKVRQDNYTITVKGGYRLTRGNAQSVQIYSSWVAAVEACEADIQCWKDAKSAEEAELRSPVKWEQKTQNPWIK